MNINNFFNHIRKLSLFALPISLAALIGIVSSFIGMTMVSHLGKNELAAGALAVTTFMPVMTIGTTIFYAIGILISHYKGQGKSFIEIGAIVKNGLLLAGILSIPITLLLWNIDILLLLFKQDPALIALTREYFHFAALCVIPSLFIMVISQFYSGIGMPRFSMIISLISCPLIIILSYGFILGHFGLPKLGLGGITCSMLIVQFFILIGITIWMLISSEIKKYQIFSGKFNFNIYLCKTIFKLGFPIGVQFGGELTAIAVSTYFMGYFGVTALAASQIASQYFMIAIMLILGLSQALSILISEAYGKQEIHLVKQYLISALTILAILFSFFMLVVLLVPLSLMGIFIDIHNINNQNLIHLVTIFFILSAILIFVDGARNFLSAALRGLHDSKVPMIVGIICLWFVSLPVSYFIGFIFSGGPIGLRIGFISGFLLASILLWVRIQRKLKLFWHREINEGVTICQI